MARGESLHPSLARHPWRDFEVPRIEGLDACATSPHGGWWYTDDGEEFRICECTAAEFARFGGFEFTLECTQTVLPPP